jgi:hypothetical protein
MLLVFGTYFVVLPRSPMELGDKDLFLQLMMMLWHISDSLWEWSQLERVPFLEVMLFPRQRLHSVVGGCRG